MAEKVMQRMANGRASHISLVKRGANQTPFKVIKSDKSGDTEVIDLQKLRKTVLKTAEKEPAIVAVVAKGADLAPDALGRHSIQVEETTESEEQGKVHVVQKASFEDENEHLQLVAISENVTVVCKGFRPYSEEFENNATFGEIMQARTIPIYDFSSILSDMLRTALYGADDKNAAIQAAQQILEDAKSYISSLFGALPETVFKMAKDSELVQKSAEETTETTTPEQEPIKGEDNAEQQSDAGEPEDSDTSGGNPGQASVEEVAGEAVKKETPEHVDPPALQTIQRSAEPAPIDVEAMAAAVASRVLETVTKSLEEKLDSKVQELETTVQSIAKSAQDKIDELDAQKSNTAVSSVSRNVTKSFEGDDSSEDSEIGVFDTAHRRPTNRK